MKKDTEGSVQKMFETIYTLSPQPLVITGVILVDATGRLQRTFRKNMWYVIVRSLIVV